MALPSPNTCEISLRTKFQLHLLPRVTGKVKRTTRVASQSLRVVPMELVPMFAETEFALEATPAIRSTTTGRIPVGPF